MINLSFLTVKSKSLQCINIHQFSDKSSVSESESFKLKAEYSPDPKTFRCKGSRKCLTVTYYSQTFIGQVHLMLNKCLPKLQGQILSVSSSKGQKGKKKIVRKAMNGIDRNSAYPLQLNTGQAIFHMYVNPGLGDTLTPYIDISRVFSFKKSMCLK